MLDAPHDQPRRDRSMILPMALGSAHQRDHVHDAPPSGSGWLRFFGYLIGALLLLAIFGSVGYLYIQRKQETRRKRFY